MNSRVYSPEVHFKHCLERILGNDIIPAYILESIEKELNKEAILNPTFLDIKLILKRLNRYTYIENIPSIMKHFQVEKKSQKITNQKITTDLMECPICFEEVTEVIKLECNHLFCESCINKIKENQSLKCPMCRKIQKMIDANLNALTKEHIDVLLNDFKYLQKEEFYKSGKNFRSFRDIIFDLAKRRGIELNA